MKKVELLSPAGNFDSLKIAVENGADALYFAGKKFGARAFSNNFEYDEIVEAINYCHLYGVKAYITINTIIYESEVEEFINYVRFIHENGVDAVIIQDIGMAHLIHEKFPNLELHASTQMNIMDVESLKIMKKIGFNRVVLARETPLNVIKKMKEEVDIELEVFVHGALCVSCSGQCYMSCLKNGRSGNRGKCAQLCRLPYDLYENSKKIDLSDKYLLSTKDLCLLDNLEELINIGIDSFKIEGRMKSTEYVGLVTRVYKNKILNGLKQKDDIINLKKMFNRNFTLGHIYDQKGKDLINGFKPNHLGILIGTVTDVHKNKASIKLIDELNQGDAIRIASKIESGFYVNKLYKKGLFVSKGIKDEIIVVDIKEDVEVGSKVYKTIDIKLNEEILNSSINRRKVFIDGIVTIKKNNIVLNVTDGSNNVEIIIENVVSKAINKPTTKLEISEKLNKLGNEVYLFNNLKIDLPDDIFISMSIINNLRREMVKRLNEKRVLKRTIVENTYNYDILKIDKTNDIVFDVQTVEQLEFILNNTDSKCYVPFDIYNNYSDNDRVLKNNTIITSFGKISNDVSLDYNFNVTNSYSLYYLHKLGAKKITLSIELGLNEIEEMINKYKIKYSNNYNAEVIIYGKPVAMISKYCLLNTYIGNGVKNNCNICKNGNYYLVDQNKNKYKIKKSNDCYMRILDYKNIDLINYYQKLNKIGISNYRIILDDESKKELITLISTLKKYVVIL